MPPKKAIGTWAVDVDGKMFDYDTRVQKKLEKAFKDGVNVVKEKTGPWTIDLKAMTQTNDESGKVRPIRRVPPAHEASAAADGAGGGVEPPAKKSKSGAAADAAAAAAKKKVEEEAAAVAEAAKKKADEEAAAAKKKAAEEAAAAKKKAAEEAAAAKKKAAEEKAAEEAAAAKKKAAEEAAAAKKKAAEEAAAAKKKAAEEAAAAADRKQAEEEKQAADVALAEAQKIFAAATTKAKAFKAAVVKAEAEAKAATDELEAAVAVQAAKAKVKAPRKAAKAAAVAVSWAVDVDGKLFDYDTRVQKKLEKAFKDGVNVVKEKTGPWTIDLKAMTQTNDESGKVRPIRREPPADEDDGAGAGADDGKAAVDALKTKVEAMRKAVASAESAAKQAHADAVKKGVAVDAANTKVFAAAAKLNAGPTRGGAGASSVVGDGGSTAVAGGAGGAGADVSVGSAVPAAAVGGGVAKDKRHATVHIVRRELNDDKEATDTIEQLVARYPTLQTHARNGDLLEDSGSAGYRSEGWAHIGVSASGELRIVPLDYDHGDDYGMPSLEFPALAPFPADYWDPDQMDSLEHVEGAEGGADVAEGQSHGGWHGDDPVVLFDNNVLGDEADGDIVEPVDGWKLWRFDPEGGRGLCAFLFKQEDVDAEGGDDEGTFLCVECLDDEIRQALCPEIERGWAIQLDGNISSCDADTKTQILAYAAANPWVGKKGSKTKFAGKKAATGKGKASAAAADPKAKPDDDVNMKDATPDVTPVVSPVASPSGGAAAGGGDGDATQAYDPGAGDEATLEYDADKPDNVTTAAAAAAAAAAAPVAGTAAAAVTDDATLAYDADDIPPPPSAAPVTRVPKSKRALPSWAKK